MGRKLNDMLAARSQESQERIHQMADMMLSEMKLQAIREALETSQTQLAEALGTSQPAVVAMEKRGADIKLSSMKRYVEAMGGKITIDVKLPTGQHVAYEL